MKSFKAEALSKLAKFANEGMDCYIVSEDADMSANAMIIAGLITVLQCMSEIADIEEELPDQQNRMSYWGTSYRDYGYRPTYRSDESKDDDEDEDDGE